MTASPEQLLGFGTGAAIASAVFIAALFMTVGMIGRMLFKHAERYGDPPREHVSHDGKAEEPSPQEVFLAADLADQTTLSIADTQRLAAPVG